jgi:hypothetical protein
VTIDDDWLLEDRIKRIRALVRLGEKHLAFVHEAVPLYLRQAEIAEARNEELLAGIQASPSPTSLRALLPPDARRDHDIALGVLIARKQTGAFDKIYKWVADVDDAAMRIFNEDRFKSYQALGDPRPRTASHADPGSAEQNLIKLSADIRARVLELTGSLAILRKMKMLRRRYAMPQAVGPICAGWSQTRSSTVTYDTCVRAGHGRRSPAQ